ncbi:hypothetical protein FQA39_LY07140 [Lamprigera yunnana]|nr:hypothetical protein FQA39_LY07140 [Lamprigera yunnana]
MCSTSQTPYMHSTTLPPSISLCNRRRLNWPPAMLPCTMEITQDAYQTAKIGTLLTIFDNGKGEQYRNKDLAEVDIDPNITLAECDYDSENENHPQLKSNKFDSTQNVTQKNNKESEVLNEEVNYK